ncbi:MAG: DNA-binding protein, partial [Pyrinomonadaceae bacterium]
MILIDSNILFDLLSEDPNWYRWSASAVAVAASESELAINPVIYAETSVRFKTPKEFDEFFPPNEFRREPLPYAAAFLAAKAHLAYR